MSDTVGYRLAGLAGVVLAVVLTLAFALDFVIIGTTGGPPVFRLDRIGSDLVRAKGSAVWIIEAWFYALLIVPFSVFAVGVYRLLRQREAQLALAGLIGTTLFWIFSTAHNAAIITVLQELVPRYDSGSPTGAGLEAAAQALLGFGNTLFYPGGGVGTLLFVVGIAATGWATLRSGGFPRWTGYVAYGSAVFSALGYLQYLADPLLALGLIGHVFYIVWIAATALYLVRLRPSAA